MRRNKIFFRADAGQSIGYGHFVRTLALAEMLKKDFDCSFFTQSPSEYQVSEVQKVCRLVPLPSDESKFEVFLSYLSGDEIVVLDNYFYSTDYLRIIKGKGCKVVCIDDVCDRHFYADAIINHGCCDCADYSAESFTGFYMGCKWALLRQPFLQASDSITRDENHWVISFGGSDPYNLTLNYVRYLQSVNPNCKISLLLGDGYAYFDAVESIPNVSIYRRQSAEQVASLFRSASCVLCSASSVCYEALACGCRVWAGYYVENQESFYAYLKEHDMICPLGDLRSLTPPINLDFHSHGMFHLDGVENRYRTLFRALSYDVVPYTTMTYQQSYDTWYSRNREEIRRWMTNPKPFSFESHCSFVESLKTSETKLYYSFFEDRTFVGSYDFVNIIKGVSAERGLFVDPDYQGSHLAKMMEVLMDGFIARRGVKYLLVEVLKDNERSLCYHRKLGYVTYKEDDKYFYLKRNI